MPFILIAILTPMQLFAQNLSKEDKMARKEVMARIWKPTIKFRSGQDSRGYDTFYENKYEEATYLGVSEEYTDVKNELEKYFLSNLFPTLHIGKMENPENPLAKPKLVYFPEGWAYADNYYRMHLQRTQVFSKNESINRFYDLTTSEGPAILVEVKSKTEEKYFYGLILKKHLDALREKLNNEAIGVIIDERDGAFYKWSKIGNQVWMAENLKFKLNDHNELEKELKFVTYRGRHYNYSQAMTSCPKGWHLPSDLEWKELEIAAGMRESDLDLEGLVSRNSDSEKQPGTLLCSSDDLMFYAHFAGAVSKSQWGQYSASDVGKRGYFWSSTKSDEVNAKFRMVGNDFLGVVRDNIGAQNHMSCRCVRDQDISVIINEHPKLKEISDRISASPEVASNYFDRSIEFLHLGEVNRSIDDIQKAITLAPNDVEQKLFKAQIYYLYSFDIHAQETKSLVEEYTNTVQDNAFAFFFQSKLELYDAEAGALNATADEGRRKNAIDLINKALELDPKNPHFLEYKAKLLVIMDNYAQAIKALDKACLSDPQNGELKVLLGKMKLKRFDQLNRKSGASSQKWCTALTGLCFKITTKQLDEVCTIFIKAIELGGNVGPDYMTLCNELEQAKTLKKHAPIVYIGPRGGRYTISSSGNKVYLPRR